MQRRKRRRSDRAGRPAMRSPGRPPATGRAEQQRFWKAIARGLSSEDAAVSCGVSPPVGGRWFREGGGMPPISLAPRSARYLSFAEREEIAILRAQGAGVRDIARRLRRAPSTVSRELRRNAATRSGGLAYRASLLSRPHSTADRGRLSVGKPHPKPSTNCYSHTSEDVLRRPLEPGQFTSEAFTRCGFRPANRPAPRERQHLVSMVAANVAHQLGAVGSVRT